MISRWWLVPLDLILGGRLGPVFAARDGFFAVRDGQRARDQQRRFDVLCDRVRDALPIPTREQIVHDLLRETKGR